MGTALESCNGGQRIPHRNAQECCVRAPIVGEKVGRWRPGGIDEQNILRWVVRIKDADKFVLSEHFTQIVDHRLRVIEPLDPTFDGGSIDE